MSRTAEPRRTRKASRWWIPAVAAAVALSAAAWAGLLPSSSTGGAAGALHSSHKHLSVSSGPATPTPAASSPSTSGGSTAPGGSVGSAPQASPSFLAGPRIAQPVFSDITMTSPKGGWAMVAKGRGLALARTNDGGSTWIDVTPKGTGSTLVYDALSDTSAWLVSTLPGKSATVYVTNDGGKRWTHGAAIPVKYGDGNAHLAVLGKSAWLEVGEAGMAAHLPSQLFRSADAGRTWKEVAETGPGTSFPGFGPLAFATTRLGFTSLPSDGTSDKGLFETKDGGATWTPVAIAGSNVRDVSAPSFKGSSGLAVAYPIQGQVSTLLSTTDNGTSWTAHPIPAGQSVVLDDVINGHEAVFATMSGDIVSTRDGGAHFTTVAAAGKSAQFLKTHLIVGASFASTQSGWALIGPKGNAMEDAALYLTRNGGRNWLLVAR